MVEDNASRAKFLGRTRAMGNKNYRYVLVFHDFAHTSKTFLLELLIPNR